MGSVIHAFRARRTVGISAIITRIPSSQSSGNRETLYWPVPGWQHMWSAGRWCERLHSCSAKSSIRLCDASRDSVRFVIMEFTTPTESPQVTLTRESVFGLPARSGPFLAVIVPGRTQSRWRCRSGLTVLRLACGTNSIYEMKGIPPNKPGAGNAGIAHQLTIGQRRPSVPEPGC